jgi:hypothetical protein
MTPLQLKLTDFASYSPGAGGVATANLELLRGLPLVFAGVLLREVIAYEWRFPAERRQIDGQLAVLTQLPAEELQKRMQGFRSLRLNSDMERNDWVLDPAGFMERLTAWLWSSGQMDNFRQSAEDYTSFLSRTLPVPSPKTPRLGVVVVGQGTESANFSLFHKLRPNGVHLTGVKPENGLATILAAVSSRAAAGPDRFDHWYIDGGAPMPSKFITRISYSGLERSRTLLLDRTQKAIESGAMGPEGLRSMLAHLKPEDVELGGNTDDIVLSRFKLALLSEGSGTQIFATTFAQWAARECLRRAQPTTLLVRYAPRQQLQPMNDMLRVAQAGRADPNGSLVDADMGAYYTWLNMNRLSGADVLRFMVWFEGHSEAVILGPGLPRGTTSDSAMDLGQVLKLLE